MHASWIRLFLPLVLPLAVVTAASSCGGGKKEATEPDPSAARDVRPTLDDDDDDADDADDGDGVQIEGGRGQLDVVDAQPVIAGAEDAILDCFTESSTSKPYVGGRVELKFRIATDGTVKRVHVAASDLGSWPIEKCVLAVARALRFPKPRGGEAELFFPIDFPARGKVVTGGAVVDSAGKELETRARALAKCDGGVPARVQVTVYVGVKGAVTSAGFATDAEEPFDDVWADCALAQALSWTLSDPRGRVLKTQAWWQQ